LKAAPAPAYDAVIVGAGMVGLAVAKALGEKDPSARLLVLEKEAAPGKHASGRNSGVLHSGIYYPPDTLKARFCREGARRMKAFAREQGVLLGEWGKVILAVDAAERPALEKLKRNADAQGIRAEVVEGAVLAALEPHAAPGAAGLHCPDTAVVDAKALVKKLAELLLSRGVEIRLGRTVAAVDLAARTVSTAEGETIGFGRLYNCAGAHADRVAHLCGVGLEYGLVPFKGLYYRLDPARAGLVKSSVYPVPDPLMPFLGVHLTKVASGEVFVGPTAIPALGRENYGVLSGARPGEAAEVLWRLGRLMLSDAPNFRRLVRVEVGKYLKPLFLRAARRLVPALREADLLPSDKAGIRPQLVNLAANRLEMDFLVRRTAESVHVLNAISPAFTSAFPFGEWIAAGGDGPFIDGASQKKGQ
jgi:L-2-hydroxyglutarate oxidase LhgO